MIDEYRTGHGTVVENGLFDFVHRRTFPADAGPRLDFVMPRVVAGELDRVSPVREVRFEHGPDGAFALRRGLDEAKDQSYFLFAMPRDELAAVLFPVGGLAKDEVRARAASLGLPNADKKESQEICFVPDGDYAAAVERIRPDALPGDGEIVDREGRVLGQHPGIHRFTVGQRRGLGLAFDGPRYVESIDAARNRVVVGAVGDLDANGANLERVSWVSGEPPAEARRASVRVRYGHSGAPAWIEPRPPRAAVVHFEQPVRAVAPGQAAVFYDGDVVLGGGWITQSLQ